MPAPLVTSELIPNARLFLTELAKDNSRAWFQTHKHRYDQDLKRPAEMVISQMTRWFEQRGEQVRGKLFRPQRDVRFTEDKSPYHVHLHMLWSRPDGRCWFFGLSPDYLTAGAGVMAFDKPGLELYRAALTDPDVAPLQDILTEGQWRLDPPELKRVPGGFPADHPNADLLRRKGLVVWDDTALQPDTADPCSALERCFARMQPLQDWLKTALTPG